MTGVGMLNLSTTVALSSLAEEVVTQYADDGVLSFLARVDEKVGSRDFTEKAAKFFADKALEQYRNEENPDAAALTNLKEFIRQVRANPAVKHDPNFYTVWTDPQAQPVHLNVDDLEALVGLAALSLERAS